MTTELPFPSDHDLIASGWIRPSRRERRILSRPRVGQVFWVDFPHDAYAPEFVGEHPGVVIRAANSLNDTCTMVPLTTRPQIGVSHTHRLSKNPNPAGKQGDCYAVCAHLYTVNICRLRPILDRRGNPIHPVVSEPDRTAIFAGVRSALRHIFDTAETAVPATLGAGGLPVVAARPLGSRTLSLPGGREE